ncbi:MAG TPA: DEAD/DEAH box helicase, partial [Methylomirabilota bacterium]|nr:DEAD/DEAH box helicase [Methylomirabilota bacterium]
MTISAPGSSVLQRWAALEELRAALAKGGACVEAHGLWGASRALVVAALAHGTGRPVLYVSGGHLERHRTALDLGFFLRTLGGGPRALEFPAGSGAAWRAGRHREPEAERALCLHHLLAGDAPVVVATPAALSGPLPPPAAFRARAFPVAAGESLDRDSLLTRLEAAGYERVETVVEVGQWSLRGGIVDIFSPARERPVRVEFFGDEVESLRVFDPTTQRSVESLAALPVLPVAAGGTEAATLTAYLPPDTLVVLDDPAALDAPPDDAPAAEPLGALLAPWQRLEMPLLGRMAGGTPRVDMQTRSVGGFRGQFKTLAEEIREWRREGFAVRLVVDDEHQAARVNQMLREHELEPWPGADLFGSEGLGVLVGDCGAGFQVPALGLLVLSEQEVFGSQRRRLRRPRFQRGAAIATFTDLRPNDLVVHETHGIGRYHGLRTLTAEGRDADFLLLEYAEGGRLYVPVERLDLVTKYMGAPEGAARLDRLGGGAWQRVKESVRAALREMAEELLRLYAARSVAERPTFSPDTPWQGEFEAAFRFEETPDQLGAIEAVKTDMEGPRPMDRLVAGDVGYGKTEVAMRAAFKAVADGRQVAVLVPTTVLAQQHYNTFAERFAPFPSRVELLSRFRSPKEQKAVLAGLASGAVDVVIGTHRLLSRDVVFKNLGLLVVDEEHRFGVAHKERLKQLRARVDVLTLSATPIPRTLNMGLSGVRDLSVIETPPADRLAVRTTLARFDDDLVREAIRRELNRSGQV